MLKRRKRIAADKKVDSPLEGMVIRSRSPPPSVTVVSLGAGSVSRFGKVTFNPEPISLCATNSTGSNSFQKDSCLSLVKKAPKQSRKRITSVSTTVTAPTSTRSSFSPRDSVFLRVADLPLQKGTSKPDLCPHFHHASGHAPPGVDHDPRDVWVALHDSSEDFHTPVAPATMDALAKFGFETAMDENMWDPDTKTKKVLKQGGWVESVWQQHKKLDLPERGFDGESEVFVWTGSFLHGLYGSDLPAVRAAGIVGMSAKALCDLLIDSSRVKEYNKMSLGRDDLVVLHDSLHEDVGPFGKSVTKIMSSKSKPPMVRKVLEFVSILHARELEDGSGYLLVSRAVHHGTGTSLLDANVMRSEILMGVNVIRKVNGDENRCLMINVNHIRSPMIPTMIAKRIGLSAAANFIQDMRSMC